MAKVDPLLAWMVALSDAAHDAARAASKSHDPRAEALRRIASEMESLIDWVSA